MEALQTSWVLFMLLLGAAGSFLAYLGALALRRREGEAAAQHGGIPPVLVALYVAVGAGMVGYVVWAYVTKPNY